MKLLQFVVGLPGVKGLKLVPLAFTLPSFRLSFPIRKKEGQGTILPCANLPSNNRAVLAALATAGIQWVEQVLLPLLPL